MARWALGASITLAASMVVHVDIAHACGGCFVQDTANTVVTGHRMALAVSLEQTVLWDQIQYDGDPTEFSWVLPIKPGARLEVSTDAWFEVLDAGTTVVVGSPQVNCGSGSSGDGYGSGYYGDDGYDSYSSRDDGSSFGCGCSSKDGSDYETTTTSGSSAKGTSGTGTTGGVGAGGGDSGPPPPPPDVVVVHEGTVGPYETVTLSADIPGVLNDWLNDHGYNVPADVQPVIDAYVAEGFDFIAMRLVPGERVKAMKPVRVISPGAGMELPLRMVAAGTGVKTALSLFVISEGRYQTQNFPNTTVPMTQVLWNFGSSSSNYSELRLDALAENDGHVWLTSYARKGVLFSPVRDGISPAFDVSYVGPSYAAATLAEAYAQQGLANGETTVLDCLAAFDDAQTFTGSVIDTCDDFGNCTDAPAGQMAAHELACGPLDDLAAGLVGMHPVDVWITRLEAELPRVSLADDLVLEAADDQLTVENRVIGDAEDDPCFGMAVPRSGRPGIRLPPGGFVTLFFAAAALVAMRRRFRRVRAEPAGGRLAARGAGAAM